MVPPNRIIKVNTNNKHFVILDYYIWDGYFIIISKSNYIFSTYITFLLLEIFFSHTVLHAS